MKIEGQDRARQDERLRRAGFEVPLRVDAPILSPGIVLLVLAIVGFVAALPAALLAAVGKVLGFSFAGGFLLIWSVLLGAYVVRMEVARRLGRFILYADRFVNRYPHPRRIGITMQEDVLRPETVRHLDRSGRRIMLWYRRDGVDCTRVDVQDADGLWAALHEWRKRAGGLYSWREAGSPIAYSQPPLEGGGPTGPFAVTVRREELVRWILEGSGERIVLEQQRNAAFKVAVISPPSLPTVVEAATNSPRAVCELRRNDGLVLGAGQRTGLREGEFTVAGRAFALRNNAILEGDREIGSISRSAGWVSAISFARESWAFAELAAVLITSVLNADRALD